MEQERALESKCSKIVSNYKRFKGNILNFPLMQASLFPHLERIVEPCQEWSEFHDELRDFNEFGTPTQCENWGFEGGSVPVYLNEFWTSKQRACHSLHEVSYRACFKPQVPR